MVFVVFIYEKSNYNVWFYHGCFWHCIIHDKCCLSWQAFDIYWCYTFEFIKAVSDTLLGIIKAAYYDKPLIFIWTTLSEDCAANCDGCFQMFPLFNANILLFIIVVLLVNLLLYIACNANKIIGFILAKPKQELVPRLWRRSWDWKVGQANLLSFALCRADD